MRVGLIGVGNMGSRMCEALLKAGYEVIVFDINPQAIERAIKMGAKSAKSSKEVAEQCLIILLSLPTPKDVEEVVIGENGILEGAKPGSLIIDLSTIDPFTTQKNAEIAKRKNVEYLDAPVLGRPDTCGQWTLPVGGSEEAFEKGRKVLEVLAKQVKHVGGPGSGNIIKLLNNVLFAVNNAAIAEIMVLGAKLGMNPKVLYETIAESPSVAKPKLFDQLVPRILKGNFETVFSIDLLHKDLDLALELGRKTGVPLIVSRSAQIINEIAKAKGLGSEDTSAVIKVLEEILNIKVRE
ncbi:MAG: NAD(P)-dependent oxidoreductase [Candidatus Methanomethylicaceae archaeon]